MAREKLSNQRCGPDREPSAGLLRALTWLGRSFECQYNTGCAIVHGLGHSLHRTARIICSVSLRIFMFAAVSSVS